MANSPRFTTDEEIRRELERLNERDETPLFSLFINQAMIDNIVKHTKEEIDRKKARYSSDQRYIGPTDVLEVKALLGLLFFSGVMRNSTLNVSDMYSHVFGPPIFRSVMSKNRFDFLLCCLRFNSKLTRKVRKMSDKFGLLLPTQYALKLTEPLYGTNRNVTCDNWFSSLELCEELNQRKITMVGTLRKVKREIPPALISTIGVPLGASRFLYQPAKVLVSYHPKRNKNVILLSSMHDTGIVNPVTKKPDIAEFYNLKVGWMYLISCSTATLQKEVPGGGQCAISMEFLMLQELMLMFCIG